MLQLFVENFPIIFGENSLSHNINGLLHLTVSVKVFGDLANFSAYPFENYLQTLKKYVKKPSQILQQISKKVDNEKIIGKIRFEVKYKKCRIIGISHQDYYISSLSPDNFCSISSITPIKVIGFKKIDRKIFITGNKFTQLESLFKEPTDSMTSLGICIVYPESVGPEGNFALDQITHKFVGLPLKNHLLLIPLLYCSI